MAVHTAAVGDHRIFHQTLISDLMTGHTAVAAVYLPVFIKQIDAAVLRVQDLHVGLPERGDGPHILPVAVKMVGVHISSVL